MNNNRSCRLLCIILFICFLVFGLCPAFADEIVLQNGDRLTGTVVKMEKQVLTLKTAYSPAIEIQVSAIKEMKTDNPAEIRLSSGEVLKGKISSEAPGQITVASSDERGATTIDQGKIAAINPPPVKWEGGITLGGNMQKGNTDRTGASAAIEGVKRGENDRFSLRYLFNYGTENKKVATRNHFGALEYDYFFVKKMYGYLGMDVLNDKFRDIQLRTTIGPGVGYQIWEDAVKALAIEGGLSYLSESHYVAANTDSWTARLGARFKYSLGKYLVFTDQATYYPSIEHSGEYLVRNEAAVSAPLGAKWAMRLSHILDYASNPPDEKKKTDTNTILGLQYKF